MSDWGTPCPNEPTDKQISYANTIHNAIGVPLPEEKTRQAYFLYIKENHSRYREWRAVCKALHIGQYARVQNCYPDGSIIETKSKKKKSDYGCYESAYDGPYGSNVVDCYDYGICPWGDS